MKHLNHPNAHFLSMAISSKMIFFQQAPGAGAVKVAAKPKCKPKPKPKPKPSLEKLLNKNVLQGGVDFLLERYAKLSFEQRDNLTKKLISNRGKPNKQAREVIKAIGASIPGLLDAQAAQVLQHALNQVTKSGPILDDDGLVGKKTLGKLISYNSALLRDQLKSEPKTEPGNTKETDPAKRRLTDILDETMLQNTLARFKKELSWVIGEESETMPRWQGVRGKISDISTNPPGGRKVEILQLVINQELGEKVTVNNKFTEETKAGFDALVQKMWNDKKTPEEKYLPDEDDPKMEANTRDKLNEAKQNLRTAKDELREIKRDKRDQIKDARRELRDVRQERRWANHDERTSPDSSQQSKREARREKRRERKKDRREKWDDWVQDRREARDARIAKRTERSSGKSPDRNTEKTQDRHDATVDEAKQKLARARQGLEGEI